MQNLPQALNALSPFKQFMLWKIEIDGKGKERKVPVSPYTLQKADPTDPQNFVDGPTAVATCNAVGGHGIAFCFMPTDPFFFVDIDKCVGDDGNWSQLALEVMAMFNGAAIEVSQSGRGLHVIGQGVPIPHGCKNIQLNLEYYTEHRFVALTGTNIVGDAATVHTDALTEITAKWFPFKAAQAEHDFEWSVAPVDNWTGPTEDEKLLERAMKSKSAASLLGGRASFSDLWTANPQKLGQCFPEINEDDPFDRSSADAALASHLAFWTGKDCQRIERLMRMSALMRDKYDRKGDDYLRRTIKNACALCRDVLGKSVEADQPLQDVEQPVALAKIPEVELKTGLQFLAGAMQKDYFKGCVYVRSLHRVLVPSGEMLKPDQFKATYGGYLFALDPEGDKTTKNAFEAFTESQAVKYPQASKPAFRPDLEPGQLFYEDGLLSVNTYYPAHVPMMQGDPTPFLNHLQLLMPDPRDREILLAYLAACVQHKGVKFQWCPLIQGAPGNGKTLFTRVVRYAVGRKFTHMPKATDLDNKFNGWLLNKIVIGVEDIYVPEHRAEIIEALKPMITGGDGQEIQFKGADQVTSDICANFILNSNHKDAVRKDENDRRFCVFFTKQQSAEDIINDGMGGEYFPRLYKWLETEGFAIVANYLSNYAIPYELNPAGGCHRAPETSSTAEVIQASQGRVEAEILEAIDEGRYGFCGGFVSSMMLDNLLDQTRSSRLIPRNRRREVMQGLGYDYHPALHKGRLNSVVFLEQGKPRIYVKRGHPAEQLDTPAKVKEGYEKAQTESTHAPGAAGVSHG